MVESGSPSGRVIFRLRRRQAVPTKLPSNLMNILVGWWQRRSAGKGRPDGHRAADALIATLSARDPVTGEHVNRVACIATEIAIIDGMDEEAILPVEIGARLHDVGKLGIPDSILKKPSRLTDGEWAVMRRHPEIGGELLRSIPALAHIASTVAAHHERWDGDGYPFGLRANAIPLEARIFALADSIDAMTSDRPYEAKRDWDYVRSELVAGAGSQWDPRLTSIALGALGRIERLEFGCPHGAERGREDVRPTD